MGETELGGSVTMDVEAAGGREDIFSVGMDVCFTILEEILHPKIKMQSIMKKKKVFGGLMVRFSCLGYN